MVLGNLTYQRTFEDAVKRLVNLDYDPHLLVSSAHKMVKTFERTGFDKEFTLYLAERYFFSSNVVLQRELDGIIDHYLEIKGEFGKNLAMQIATRIN